MRSFIRTVTAFSLIFLLYGCASLDSAVVIEGIRAKPDSGAYIGAVPFFSQNTQLCGPSALASVIGFYKEAEGLKVSYGAIAEAVYSEKLKGSLGPDMLLFAREAGFNAVFYSGGFDDLKKRIDSHSPLILFINLGLDLYPVGHYIVVVGYSKSARAVVARSGSDKEKVFSYAELEKAWSKTGYSTLLITPAGPAAVMER